MDEYLNYLRRLGLSAARGIPQLATGFVDLAALPFTMSGLIRPEDAVGSTAYLTERGLLPRAQDGIVNETTELLASAVNPASLLKAGAIGTAGVGSYLLGKYFEPIPGALSSNFPPFRLKKNVDVDKIREDAINQVIKKQKEVETAMDVKSKSGKITKEQKDPLGYSDVAMPGSQSIYDIPVERERMPGVLRPYIEMDANELSKYTGYGLIPLYGDRTPAKVRVGSVGPYDLQMRITEGGRDHMRKINTPDTWASKLDAAAGLAKGFKIAQERLGVPGLIGSYTAMSPQGLDFSLDMAQKVIDAVAKKLPNIKKKNLKMMDKRIKNYERVIKGKDSVKPFKDFPGLASEKFAEYMLKLGGTKRAELIGQVMDKAAFTNAGFPQIGLLRYALTEEDLNKSINLTSGRGLTKLETEGKVIPSQHPTYSGGLPGDYIGGLSGDIPLPIMFRDAFNVRRMQGDDTSKADARSIMMNSKQWAQLIDQQLIDEVGDYLRLIQRDN